MRSINIENLEALLPNGWLERAASLRLELEDKTPEERTAIFKHHPIWQDLLVPLKRLSNNKCWYSEAQEVMSDMDVDHFRPKNEAIGFDGNGEKVLREGYWWLAYDWRNYRLSSIYSNRLRKDKHTEEDISYGKGAFFPLRQGCIPATCQDELDEEVFYLLDPINPSDSNLLFFNDEGKAMPSILEEDEPWNFQRAKVTIDIYHLNHTPLKDARKVVWNLCQRKINELKAINQKAHRSARDEERVLRIREELSELIIRILNFQLLH